MNVAFVLSYWADRFGGPVTAVKSLGPRLHQEGHTVSYWASGTEADRAECASLPNVHLYEATWPRRWHRSPELARALAAAAPATDLFHINSFWLHPTFAAARMARDQDVPYILRPAGTLEPWSLKRRRLKWLKKALYLSLVAKSTMEHAACLHACSMKEAESFRQIGYRGPVAIIPNGVDTEHYTPGDAEEANAYWPQLKDRPVLVFMSRLSPEKGLDLLIPLWAEFVRSKAHRDGILVVAGPDDRGYQATVAAMIDRHGLGAHVLMPGMVRAEKRRALLRRADIFTLPSYSENFGIVVAEALACGTPVVATTGTPWQDLETAGAGRWVSPTQDHLRTALHELLTMSDSERQQMGRKGRALVCQRYTWDQAARKLVTVCEAVSAGAPIPLHPEPSVSGRSMKQEPTTSGVDDSGGGVLEG